MATFKFNGLVSKFEAKLINGITSRIIHATSLGASSAVISTVNSADVMGIKKRLVHMFFRK